ncbi:MAG: hypothetical protein WCL44_08065 [bacterium]
MADKAAASQAKKVKKTAEEAGSKKDAPKFPSPFGSHASMDRKELTEELQKKQPLLSVLEDENGLYVTETTRLDNKMADPNRYAGETHRKEQLVKAGVEAGAAKK